MTRIVWRRDYARHPQFGHLMLSWQPMWEFVA